MKVTFECKGGDEFAAKLQKLLDTNKMELVPEGIVTYADDGKTITHIDLKGFSLVPKL